MKVYVLTFEVGISSGCKELIGIYESEERTEEALEKHMEKYAFGRYHYHTAEIELNKEVNIIFSEW